MADSQKCDRQPKMLQTDKNVADSQKCGRQKVAAKKRQTKRDR